MTGLVLKISTILGRCGLETSIAIKCEHYYNSDFNLNGRLSITNLPKGFSTASAMSAVNLNMFIMDGFG